MAAMVRIDLKSSMVGLASGFFLEQHIIQLQPPSAPGLLNCLLTRAHVMNRRDFLGGVAAVGLSGCARRVRTAATPPVMPAYEALPRLMPIRARIDPRLVALVEDRIRGRQIA